MSPATAFCKSFRHASEMKSSATSGEQRVPRKADTTTSLAGVSGSVSRGLPRSHTDASGSRCAGNQTTDGTTAAPAAYGANGAGHGSRARYRFQARWVNFMADRTAISIELKSRQWREKVTS
ncbi:hypothetical protein KPA97_24315 [Burkholderia cenocepacia]|nr:hypothetical protein [Burkholderia cenocepacia]